MCPKQVPLKRYTPPTCTLEIWANSTKTSAFWLPGSSKNNELEFALHFDDPKFSEEEQVTLEGTTSDLELLSNAVINYVHHFLGSVTLSNNLSPKPTQTPQKSPVLASLGLLSHKLLFGDLGASKPTVTLSASQLFDLVEILEQYQADAQTLSTTASQSKRKFSIALLTGVVLAFSALSLYLWQSLNLQNNSTSQIAQERSIKKPSSNLIPVIPPSPSPNSRLPVPSPLVPSDLAKQKPLTTPDQVVVPTLPPSPSQNLTPPSNDSVITVYPSPPQPSNPPATNTAKPSANPPILEIEPNQTDALTDDAETAKTPLVVPPEVPLDKIEQKESTLLDTIPQVLQVREYFQQRWKVPEGLTQTLEYSLKINNQGSLTRIIPLGRAATIYLDRTSMPLLNEPFVSPLTSQETATIRLVLLNDGTVKTFLEENSL